jgi:hypothetical protein
VNPVGRGEWAGPSAAPPSVVPGRSRSPGATYQAGDARSRPVRFVPPRRKVASPWPGLRRCTSPEHSTANKQVPGADATLALPRAALVDVLLGRTTLGKEIERGRARVEGSRQRIADLLALLVTFDPMFNIVTP